MAKNEAAVSGEEGMLEEVASRGSIQFRPSSFERDGENLLAALVPGGELPGDSKIDELAARALSASERPRDEARIARAAKSFAADSASYND